MTQTRFHSLIASGVAVVLMLVSMMSLVLPANAQFSAGSPSGALTQTVGQTSLATGDANAQVFNIIGRIINIVLGLLGIIFFIFIVWAGFIWMTAAGDSGKIDKAKQMLIQGTIGMVIVLAAYAISNFAVSQLLTATQAP